MDYNKLSKQVFSGTMSCLFSDGSMEDITDYIKIMRIEGNFEEYVMPIMFIKFDMRPDIIIKIQDDDSVLLNLNMNYVDELTSNSSVYENFFKNILFAPIRMDKTPINYTDKLIAENAENYQYESFELIAVPKNCLDQNKTLISGVLNEASITDALVFLTSKLGCHSVIEKPDNDKKYDQIIMIPGNIFMNIKFLEDTYGIYNKGSKYFFTNKRLIISNREKFFNGDKGKININVRFPVNDKGNIVYDIGNYRNGNDLIINTIIDNIKLSDHTDSFKEIYTNNQYYFSRDLYTLNQRKNSFEEVLDNKKIYNKARVIYNRYNNEQKENEFLDHTRDSTTIEFFFDNMNIELDDAFKVFYINFDNNHYKKYNGQYYALNIGYHFVKKQSIFDMKALITLKKKEKLTSKRK